MNLYQLSTDEVSTDQHYVTREKEKFFLLHEQIISKEIFTEQVKEAYQKAKRYAPNHLRDLVNGQPYDVPMHQIVVAMSELYGYEPISLSEETYLPKKLDPQKEKYIIQDPTKSTLTKNSLLKSEETEDEEAVDDLLLEFERLLSDF